MKIAFGPSEYEIAVPFSCGILEEAADHVDRVNELNAELMAEIRAGRQPKIKLLNQVLASVISAFAVPICKKYPDVTLESLKAQATLGDLDRFRLSLLNVLNKSGLVEAGEAAAPGAAVAVAPRKSRSRTRSAA